MTSTGFNLYSQGKIWIRVFGHDFAKSLCRDIRYLYVMIRTTWGFTHIRGSWRYVQKHIIPVVILCRVHNRFRCFPSACSTKVSLPTQFNRPLGVCLFHHIATCAECRKLCSWSEEIKQWHRGVLKTSLWRYLEE